MLYFDDDYNDDDDDDKEEEKESNLENCTQSDHQHVRYRNAIQRV